MTNLGAYSKSEVDSLVSANSGSWTVLADETYGSTSSGIKAVELTVPDLRNYKEFFVAVSNGVNNTDNAMYTCHYLRVQNGSSYYPIRTFGGQGQKTSAWFSTDIIPIIPFDGGTMIASNVLIQNSSNTAYAIPLFTSEITKLAVATMATVGASTGYRAVLFAR